MQSVHDSQASSVPVSGKHLAGALGRTLLLLPHSDDECAAGGLLQHLTSPSVLFLTNSAPRDAYFWQAHGSRRQYEEVRRNESRASLAALGFTDVNFGHDYERPADQELYRDLPIALDRAFELAQSRSFRTVLAPAYEGGHPDHDAASFIAAQVAARFGLEHWELPYYHRTRSSKFRVQTFLPHPAGGIEFRLALTPAECSRKETMWDTYRSQSKVLADFDPARELYRRAPQYDFARPPHAGVLNYEAWGWANGAEVTAAFTQVLEHLQIATPASAVPVAARLEASA
ncbi:MAG TPA: PIG-L family deacetylase [Terriglobales bacterium]